MNQEECKYYRFGYSGCNYLCINRSVYTQSELLPNGIIREIQCDKDDKWMKVRERKKEKQSFSSMSEEDKAKILARRKRFGLM